MNNFYNMTTGQFMSFVFLILKITNMSDISWGVVLFPIFFEIFLNILIGIRLKKKKEK